MDLDLLIGVAGVLVTLLVVVAMILITPHGATTRPRADEADAGPGAAADAAADTPRAPGSATRPSLPTLP